MKKFLCFVLVLCLALSPMAVFAEEYDNDENGQEYEYVNGVEEAEENEYENGEEEEAEAESEEEAEAESEEEEDAEAEEEEEEVEEEAEEDYEEVVPISAELGQEWSFGMGNDAEEQGIDGWYFSHGIGVARERAVFADGYWVAEGVEGWYLNPASGEIMPADTTALIEWVVPAAGTFNISGNVIANSVYVTVYINYEQLIHSNENFEVDYEFVLLENDTLKFYVAAVEDAEEASANLNVVIREVADEEVEEAVEDDAEEEQEEIVEDIEEEVEEEVEEEAAEEVEDPLANVPVRVVDGVEYVAFRAFANAMGYYELAWDGATATVTVVNVTAFTVEEAGGFNDNGTVFVPASFALSLF